MDEAQPSRTALRVALRRAAHQVVDAEPLVLRDPLALRLLAPADRAEVLRTPKAERRPHSASLRAWMVGRSRLAEDALAAAVAGLACSQYLVLGAGLDTFAYRNPHAAVRVFEVDHPATQAWKRGLLAAAGMAVPDNAALVAVDFERDSLRDRLRAARFDFAQVTVVAWLGVAPYLTAEAFRATLAVLGELPPGSEVVLDYARPRHTLGPVEQLMFDSLAARVAQAGEPFRLFLTPEEIATEMRMTGLAVVEDLGRDELNMRYFAGRTDGLALAGGSGRIVRAVVAR